MSQLFNPRANELTKLLLWSVGAVLILGSFTLLRLNWSPWNSGQNRFVEQPVPFSHEHHVSGLGIDCRYCHTSVEQSSTAGMPPTQTCMTCHSQLWTESDMLELVRESYRTGKPLQWNRVHDLPDYVYFNHSIHVNKGVGCESCHGRVDQMPLIYQAKSLHMSWCLDCHREPEKHLRPNEFIYAFGYDLPDDEQLKVGSALIEEYEIPLERLTNCSTCHR